MNNPRALFDEPGPVAGSRSLPAPSRLYQIIAWGLLLLLGLFFLFASLSDLAADARTGLPSDHTLTFAHVAGTSWAAATKAVPRLTRYITLLEYAYAVHELVFAILFLAIVAIPFRRGAVWAWWACWAVMLANITYSLTFGQHDTTVLYRSLIADIALPVLLLVQVPAFFGSRRWSKARPERPGNG